METARPNLSIHQLFSAMPVVVFCSNWVVYFCSTAMSLFQRLKNTPKDSRHGRCPPAFEKRPLPLRCLSPQPRARRERRRLHTKFALGTFGITSDRQSACDNNSKRLKKSNKMTELSLSLVVPSGF